MAGAGCCQRVAGGGGGGEFAMHGGGQECNARALDRVRAIRRTDFIVWRHTKRLK